MKIFVACTKISALNFNSLSCNSSYDSAINDFAFLFYSMILPLMILPSHLFVPFVSFSENSSSMKENHNCLRSEPIGTTRAFSSSVVSAAHEDFC
jgi:hypothetical protein